MRSTLMGTQVYWDPNWHTSRVRREPGAVFYALIPVAVMSAIVARS